MDNLEIVAHLFYQQILILLISLPLIWLAWCKLKNALSTLPVGSQRVIYNVKAITNKYTKGKAELISALHLACIFLGVSIFVNAFSVAALSSRLICAPMFINDFKFICSVLPVGTISFFSGFYALALVLMLDFMVITRGKGSPLLYQPTDDVGKKEYESVFSTSLALRAQLSVEEKKLKCWQKRRIDWIVILAILFVLVQAICTILESLVDNFPSWTEGVAVGILAIAAIIVVLVKGSQQ